MDFTVPLINNGWNFYRK